MNWYGVASNPWVIGIAGSLAATGIWWLLKRIIHGGKPVKGAGVEQVLRSTVQQNASPVITQSFQPIINIINVPIAGPSKDSSETSGNSSAGRSEPADIDFKFLLHMAIAGDRWYQPNTRGGGSQIEGFELDFTGINPGLGCEYMVHLGGFGDTEWTPNGEFAGTRGESRALEGLAIRLTGPAKQQYSVWYSGKRACRPRTGPGFVELAPVSDGQFLGTRGQYSPLTELEVHIVRRTWSDISMSAGEGDKGGKASVGGSGIAVGGRGGNAGRYGRGGDGGSAVVHGNGTAPRLRHMTKADAKSIAIRIAGAAMAIVLLVGVAWKLQSPTLTILYGNKDLDGQTIETGGRADVLNGLVIPTFQIKSTENVTILGVRLYLSEGSARWDGPWEPTPSDENDFPAEYYYGARFQISRHETWNIPNFTAQRSKGIPWDQVINARIKVYYGASAPLTADFTLRNNS